MLMPDRQSAGDELCYLSVAEAAREIGRGALSPVELTEAYLARIADLDPQLNSHITVTADQALRRARAAQEELRRGLYRGPLHGIPFGLKDMFDTAGIRTTGHSRLLADNYPTTDAFAVSRLYAAGAILLGKHATHEFAHGGPSFDLPWPPARNPWNTAHYTGGSSSGSAAAVAGGLAAAALGTDTGGSVRSPSFLCGTVGLKPTFGLVSRTGVIPFSMSCDHVGPITRTVDDSAIMLQAIAGYDPADPGSAARTLPDLRLGLAGGVKGMRIGVIRHFWEEDAPVNAELQAAVETAIEVLRGLGAQIEDVRLRSLHDYYAVRIVLTESELFARHQQSLRHQAGQYGEHFLGRILAASLFTAADYIAAQRERRRIIAQMQPLYERFDALLTIGSGPAPALGAHRSIGSRDKWSSPGMTPLFSLTGAPALALPCGFSANGLPLGMQIAGRPFDDATVLRIGYAYEAATRWTDRHPLLHRAATMPAIHAEAAKVEPVEAMSEAHTLADALASRAGLHLTAEQRAMLHEAASYALAMVQRIPRDLDWIDEQASTFKL
jgi:aspartyl-tRNA(Asn)/glutamyl-tRNA(Gln) amidotransferase subunit A